VSNIKPAAATIGRINADPNPIPFGQGCVLISWETNDPAGAEVHVSTSPGEEKVVSRGRSGHTKIRWIVGSTAYDSRLYAASQPTAPVDSVEVRRDFESVPVIFRELADECYAETGPGASSAPRIRIFRSHSICRP
jgi:hypothetical protein